ncbi:hypothetical protein IWW39_000433 [Coemansia spiralis]|uniref:Uncharacterized protein n=1 Tax=Coemansia spiralis TaxID=417178 RepID=A0A9W8GPZ8_9FUNG|nr:hypothetical protein IWW39_000433 [Coemansia spiralis]
MLTNTFSTISLLAFALLATTANAHPQPQPQEHASGAIAKRWHGCGTCGGYGGYGGFGGYGGYGGFGFPLAASFTNDFDRNSNYANFNENTFYSNNVNANAASDNVHSFNNANIIA